MSLHIGPLTDTLGECIHIHTALHKQLQVVLCVSQHVDKTVLFLLTPFLSFGTTIFNKEVFVSLVVYLPTPSTCRLSLIMLNCNQVSYLKLSGTMKNMCIHSTVDQNITAYWSPRSHIPWKASYSVAVTCTLFILSLYIISLWHNDEHLCYSHAHLGLITTTRLIQKLINNGHGAIINSPTCMYTHWATAEKVKSAQQLYNLYKPVATLSACGVGRAKI